MSGNAIEGEHLVETQSLFDAHVPPNVNLELDPRMHLSVSVRSPRARHLADWVDAVLTLDAARAHQLCLQVQGFRLAMTRNLERLRQWLRDAARDEMRCGLLASSGSLRLRPYGIETNPQFLNAMSVERWFLDGREDFRSSDALEIAMTEFKVQGLEIDYSGVCWSDDLTIAEGDSAWDIRRLRGSSWQVVRKQVDRTYALNKYRVLLTRAREGMIIWVPPGDASDRTRDPARLDRTARFLQDCGLPEV